MSPVWVDLVARARGMGTHLADAATLERLARSPDAGSLARELQALGELDPATPVAARAADLDRGVRRIAARRMALLGRWAGPRRAILAVLFEDEERRNLRALLRGAVAATPPTRRRALTVPTPLLPERALEELSQLESPAKLAALLTAWGHPYAGALASARTKHEAGGLLEAEAALDRAFAERARAGARRGDGALRDEVRLAVDAMNVGTVLAGSAGADAETRLRCFVAGGRWLDEAAFARAVAAADDEGRAALLARAFVGSPLARVFARRVPTMLLRELRSARIAMAWRAALLDPVGTAPVIHLVLRMRAHLIELRRIIWSISLEVAA